MAAEVATPLLGPRWTAEQRRGISTTGQNLLVSAAAGSGKTAVLAERCVHLICDAEDKCDIDQLLVVTFTDAAAAEMRSRITDALRKRYQAAPTPRIAEQLALAEQAQVSTIHAFCAKLLRQHFSLAGLDPGFTVLDAEEAALMRREIAGDLFERHYNDESGAFHRLIDGYGQGNDQGVLQQVLHVHELLTSVIDPAKWRSDARQRIAEAALGPLENSRLGAELLELVRRGVSSLLDRAQAAEKKVAELGFAQYAGYLHDAIGEMAGWEAAAQQGIDPLAERINAFEWSRLPTIRGDVPGKDLAKSIVDSIRDEVKACAWRDMLRFTSAQWRDGLSAVLPHADMFLGLVEEFDRDYRQAKTAARAVDFADLERLAFGALCEGATPLDRGDAGSVSPVIRGEGCGELLAGKLRLSPTRSPQPSPPSTGEREQCPRPQQSDGTPFCAAPVGNSTPSPLARAYHRQFAHVLVDEYQDINELQDAILSLVSRECLDRSAGGARQANNLFCVGDVKQSIYRFRLADPLRFLDRQADYRKSGAGGAVIDLQANFRSRAPLLDAINGVFRCLMTRAAVDIEYDQTHFLHPGLNYPAIEDGRFFEGSPIDLHLLPKEPGPGDEAEEGSACADEGADELDRTEREALLVAREILRIVGKELAASEAMRVCEKDDRGELAARPAEFRDIVILLRSMKFKAEQFARVLRLHGIGVHAASRGGFFESTEIRDMLALLSLLDNARQDIPLAALLRGPLCKLPEPETSLARIRVAYPDPLPFYEAVAKYRAEKHDAIASHLNAFFATFEQWRHAVQRRPLAEVIWAIYLQSGYLAYVSGLADGEQRARNLMNLHERAAQFGDFHRRGLSRFLRFLEQVREESDLGQPSVASQADNVVRIMSVHGAKGLEYPIVVLPDLGKRINLQDCQGQILADRQAGLGMVVVDDARRARYPSLASTLVQARLRQQSLAEELRVLYVAMTRAREHLILVGTCDFGSMEKWGSRWSGHQGALPTEAILGAQTMLDWIGPVSVLTQGPSGGVFNVIRHSPEDMSKMRMPGRDNGAATAEQLAMRRLEKWPTAPASSQIAQRVIDQLSYVYPWQAFSQTRASDSVTSRGHAASAGGNTAGSTPPPVPPRPLAKPRFMEIAELSAADRGTATHLVLQHLNFAGACDLADLSAQVQSLVQRRILLPAQAQVVDVAGILWMLNDPVGQLLRREPSAVRRELALNFPAPVNLPSGVCSSSDPMDQVMIRGRIDLLVLGKAGATLLDYKTDRIDQAEVPARAEVYRPQLQAYREAMQRIAGIEIKEVYLAFLSPRVMYSLAGSGSFSPSQGREG